MLEERVKSLARHHQMDIDEALIREAVMLATRYIPMRQFPDKAIDILDLACALQATRAEDRTPPSTIAKHAEPQAVETKGAKPNENTNVGTPNATSAQ